MTNTKAVKDQIGRLRLMQEVIDEIGSMKQRLAELEAMVQMCECDCQRYLHGGPGWPHADGVCIACPRGCCGFRPKVYRTA